MASENPTQPPLQRTAEIAAALDKIEEYHLSPLGSKKRIEETLPWALKTPKEWELQERTAHTGKLQAAWFIIVAAACEQTDQIHDRAFLQKWKLDVAYDTFFAAAPDYLEVRVQSGKRFALARQEFLARNPHGISERQAEVHSILTLFENPDFLPFLITIREMRNGKKLEARNDRQLTQSGKKGNAAEPPIHFLEIAGERMGLSEETLSTLTYTYHELIFFLCERFRLNGRFHPTFRKADVRDIADDIMQDDYLQLVDAIATFPYWETMLLHPSMTCDRLFAYVRRSLPGFKKETDGSRVAVRMGKDRDGEEISLDIYRAGGLDPSNVVIDKMSYHELQQMVFEEAKRLDLDPPVPEMLSLTIEGKSIKEIAQIYNMNQTAVGRALLRLRKAVAARIDPERLVRRNGGTELSLVWESLLNPESLQIVKRDIDRYPIRQFQKRALELAIEKAGTLCLPVVDVSAVKKELIAYVASGLQRQYPKVSQDVRRASATARRAIQRAWNIIHGVEEDGDAKGHKRAGFYRDQEAKDWQNFTAANPDWGIHFSPLEQQIISLYYLSHLNGGKRLTQAEIGEMLHMDYSRVSRRLEQIAQRRIRLRNLEGMRQVV